MLRAVKATGKEYNIDSQTIPGATAAKAFRRRNKYHLVRAQCTQILCPMCCQTRLQHLRDYHQVV